MLILNVIVTELALAKEIENLDEIAAKSDGTKGGDLPGSSVLDAINQRVKGDIAFIDIAKIQLHETEERLYLLRGSVDLSSIEDDLAEAHVQRLAMRTNLMRTYVAIGDFIVRLAKDRDIDYVFIDVGPSSGAITRAFFLACDAFFLPVAPDRFNIQAIGTLSTIVDRWMTEHNIIFPQYRELGLPIRSGSPAFLGAIVQAFKLYGGRPKPGFQLWMDRIPTQIKDKLEPVMTKKGRKYLPSGNDEIAVQISDFHQLAPLMQETGKAIFKLSRHDTALISESGSPWMGNNWRGSKS